MSAWFDATIKVTDRDDIVASGKIDPVTGPYVRLSFQALGGSSVRVDVPLAIVDEIAEEIGIARSDVDSRIAQEFA